MIHSLCRMLITRWQLVNQPQAKSTSVLDLSRANAQTVGQLEAFELVRTTETQWARAYEQRWIALRPALLIGAGRLKISWALPRFVIRGPESRA